MKKLIAAFVAVSTSMTPMVLLAADPVVLHTGLEDSLAMCFSRSWHF